MGRAASDLVFETLAVERLVVSCQTKFNPTDAEWNRWLMAVGNLEQQSQTLRLLVMTEGGHPTKEQVERLRALNKKNPLTAIVSPSLALRFMGGALTFVNPTIRCFPPAQLEKALEHLGLLPAERKQARSTVERLQRELGVVSAAG